MNEGSLIDVMIRETARAVPWGIMLLVVLLIGSMWFKQDAKQVAAFTSQAMVNNVKKAVLDPEVFIPLKQTAKEAVQYTAHTAIQEAKDAVLRSDTVVPIKHEVKKAIEYTAVTAANQYIRAESVLDRRH